MRDTATPTDSALAVIEDMLWGIVEDPAINPAVRVQAARELRFTIKQRLEDEPEETAPLTALRTITTRKQSKETRSL